jgi:hypothetical protein
MKSNFQKNDKLPEQTPSDRYESVLKVVGDGDFYNHFTH